MLKLLRRIRSRKLDRPVEIYTEVPFATYEPTARAYVNHGAWKADCPRMDCSNAAALTPRQGMFQCSNCLLVAPVEWPPNAQEIWDELTRRPVPSTRNWFPDQHALALAAGCPHGQTVRELRDEFAAHGGSQ